MKRAEPLFQQFLISTLALLCLFLLPDAARAQQDPKCQPWIGIKSWDVTIHISGSGENTNSLGQSASLQESDDLQFRLTLDPNSAFPCAGTWSWTSVQSAKENIHINASTYSGGASGCRDDLSYSRANVDGGGGSLSMDFEKGTYGATFGVVIGPTGNGDFWDNENYSGNCNQVHHAFDESSVLSYDPTCAGYSPALQYLIDGGLPGSGALGGSATYTCPSQALGSGGSDVTPSLNLFSWSITWSMTPTPANIKLVVTIPSYETWRPTAGRAEKDVGIKPGSTSFNVLGIRAQLMDKDTGMPSYLVPDKMTFNLADVSREPGVAMNWPAQGTATTDPDLTFDCEFNFNPTMMIKVDSKDCTADFTVTGMQIEVDPDNSNPVAVSLSPHDWGGWGTLNVTATVAGVAYEGSLDSDPGNTDILIPKRESGSFIADGWKTGRVDSGVGDGDDAEDDPKGDGQSGDGFTLYEEYRGFYMGCSDNGGQPQEEGTPGAGCQHAEGDPTTKDLFIVDNIGTDEGISLFQFASGLDVHFHGLKPAEVGPPGPSYRVINFNHAAAPHEVDQHALVIEWGSSINGNGLAESRIVNTKGFSGPALPKHIDHIEITTAYKSLEAPDTTVAHELSHAVDVYHHGDVDHNEFWTFDRQTLTVRSGSNAISVLLESSDLNSPDPADQVDADLPRLGVDQVQDNNPKDQNGKPMPGRWVYVGNTVCRGVVMMNGQHSGDQLDIMRYHAAQAYIPAGFPDIRIWIGPGAEATGVDLTDHPGGTGVNDPNRGPRPRYGDAFAGTGSDGRGNDRSQVDVNDKNSEITRTTQTCR
jgi:hypothetical protein